MGVLQVVAATFTLGVGLIGAGVWATGYDTRHSAWACCILGGAMLFINLFASFAWAVDLWDETAGAGED